MRMEILTPEKTQRCLTSIIEHWVKARIDGPMQALARYDDAAKQLITIGGFLQGGLIAVYSALGRQQGSLMNRWQMGGLLSFEICLIGFLSFSAWSCSLQPEMQAKRISSLLKQALEQCISETYLVGEVEAWCWDVESKVKSKKFRMAVSKTLFIFCTAIMSLLLLSQVMH
jgi:hypothetical protein